MEKRAITKGRRIVIIITVLLGVSIILPFIIGGGYYLITHLGNLNKISDFKSNVTVIEPGAVYGGVSSHKLPEYMNERLAIDTIPVLSQKSFKIFGDKYSGVYGAYSYDRDSDLVCNVGVESEFKGVSGVMLISGVVTEERKVKVLYLADENQRSADEAEELAEALAGQLLGDLSEYTRLVKRDVAVRQRRCVGYVYAKYNNGIRLEDYAEIWFATDGDGYSLHEIDYDNDHANEQPKIDAANVCSYVGDKVRNEVYAYYENGKGDTASKLLSCGAPYELSIHVDPNGKIYVNCSVDVTLLLTDANSVEEKVLTYEYYIYLPEEFQS